MEEERQEDEGKIASMSLLSAIQTKVGEQTYGLMYVETEVEGKKLEVTMDTGAELCIWQRNLPMRFVFLTQRKKVLSKELTLRAYRSMELLVTPTYKLGHRKVRST